MKKIAICIPNYNRIDLFKRLLFQLLSQIKVSEHKSSIEICISDDGSETDITGEMNEIINDNSDISIKFHRFPKNTGLMNNMKYSVEMSDAEYCWIIGNDDMLYDNAVDMIIENIDNGDILMFPIMEHSKKENKVIYPSKNDMNSRIFDFSKKEDFELWFDNIDMKAKQGNNAGLFIFISNIIFKKSNWDKYSRNCDWDNNSLFHQSYIHLKTLFNDGIMYYFSAPLVVRNATFDGYIVMSKRIFFSYCVVRDICDFISYFFDGELEKKFLNENCFFHFYGCIMNSDELSVSQKQQIKSIKAEPIEILNEIFIPASEYSKLRDKTILLFGSGEYGIIAKSKLESNGIKAGYYIDNDKTKHGKFIDGVEIISPEKSLEIPDGIYIITAYVQTAFCDVYKQLKQMNIPSSSILAVI
ncbi:MAG: glycosyltransferase [Fibromonadaceae bacterium]|jgi:abequosyltransferase|nr:glycosyltransferase [Fibromonadaceae bacterium]